MDHVPNLSQLHKHKQLANPLNSEGMIQILFLDLDTIGILTIITKLIAQFLPSMKTVTIDNKITT